MSHRFLAGAFAIPLFAVIALAWSRRSEAPGLGLWATALVVLYIAQVTLGALNVWYEFPDLLTVSHTLVASAIWFLLTGLAVVAYYEPGRYVASQQISREVPA